MTTKVAISIDQRSREAPLSDAMGRRPLHLRAVGLVSHQHRGRRHRVDQEQKHHCDHNNRDRDDSLLQRQSSNLSPTPPLNPKPARSRHIKERRLDESQPVSWSCGIRQV